MRLFEEKDMPTTYVFIMLLLGGSCMYLFKNARPQWKLWMLVWTLCLVIALCKIVRIHFRSRQLGLPCSANVYLGLQPLQACSPTMWCDLWSIRVSLLLTLSNFYLWLERTCFVCTSPTWRLFWFPRTVVWRLWYPVAHMLTLFFHLFSSHRVRIPFLSMEPSRKMRRDHPSLRFPLFEVIVTSVLLNTC